MFLARFAALAVGLTVAAAPAAALTTIATFATPTSSANVRWQGAGSSAQFFTIANASATVPGAALVDFSLLQPSIAPFVTNLPALFTLNATVTSTPAVALAGQFFQGGITGNFSFTTTTGLTVGSTFFAAGSNLLSGTFNQTLLYGAANGSTATMLAATSGGSGITFASDFLDFTGVANYNVSLPLSALRPALFASTGSSLRTFVATSSGAFASDAPSVIPIPEPESWALMIAGFAMVGTAARRRARTTVTA